jgi:uncharacterized protein YjiS (DUF1127 family)
MASERISLDHAELQHLPMARLHSAWDMFKTWREQEHARQLLARFDARMLEDIGITETEAWRETRLPFWRK